ncbi:ABC transporter substrate-binding protein [Synergistales bacterium]|nr:ABC transporter substrate-binding protein [Synergistales bacterium]
MKKTVSVKIAIILIAVFLATCGSTAPTSAAESDPIIIGSVNDLSGNRSVTGNAINRGAQIAADEINAAGGVLGRKIKFISYDNKNDGQESINAYARLVDVDGASAVVAPDASSICLTLIEISNEKKVPIVGMPSDPRATMDMATGLPNPYMFLVSQPNAIGQASLIASYLKDNTKWTQAAIFYDQSNAYAVVSCEAFIKEWKAMGKSVVITETCNANDQDFKTQLSKIKASGAEFIYTPNPTVQLVLMVQQAAQLGIELPYAGAMDMANPFLSLLNDPKSISLAYFEAIAWMKDPRLDALNATYNKRYGEDAMVKAVNGYDAMYILKAAMEAAKSSEPEAIRDALENKINGIKTLVSDHYSHDPATHAPLKLGMVICKIENGELSNQGFYEIGK